MVSYVETKYGEKKNCVTWIKTVSLYIYEDIFKDIAEYVEARFNTSSYELNKPLPKEKK